jgi:hypothetical protein
MVKRILFSISTLAISIMMFGGIAAAQGQYVAGSVGVDVSWPNCSASIPSVAFGIVGVSNGTGYSTNPCLTQQASKFSNLSFYLNTGWNNKSTFINPNSPRQCASNDQNCLAYNYGYNAGVYAVNAASGAGLHSSTWWLDVETINTWNSDTNQNRNSLQGEYDALVANGASTVGAYSTSAQWQTITNGWKNNWPSWGATTWNTADQAKTYCKGHEFTGGPSYLMQYLPKKSKIDYNVAC